MIVEWTPKQQKVKENVKKITYLNHNGVLSDVVSDVILRQLMNLSY